MQNQHLQIQVFECMQHAYGVGSAADGQYKSCIPGDVMLLKKIFNRFLDHNMNKVKSYKPDDQISLSSNHLISFSSKIAIISAIRLDCFGGQASGI